MTDSQPVAGPKPVTDPDPVTNPHPATDPQTATDTEAMTYETAAARVEEIIRRLDSGEASLNETLALVQEGKSLIELCAGELEAVGAALEELRLDELVARLESQSGTGTS
jgi:exodeoxyribonuclease VII small subunit